MCGAGRCQQPLQDSDCPAHHLGERCQDARQQVAPRGTGALYAYITDVAFAHNVVNPTTELARYIRDVNDMIAEVNAAYNQRTGQTKAQTESVPVPPPTTDTEPGTTPEPEPTPDPEPDPDTGEDDDDEGGLAG